MTPRKIVLFYFLALISVVFAQTHSLNLEGKYGVTNDVDEIAYNARFPRRSSNKNYKTEGGHGENYQGVIGPVHTFVKTDRNAHFKWGVRHYYVDQGSSGHH